MQAGFESDRDFTAERDLRHSSDATGRLEPLAVPFGSFKSVLRRHLYIVLLAPAVGAGSTYAVLHQMPRQFTAEASILVEPQRTQVSDLQAISPDAGDVGGLVRTQIDILRSPALMMRVAKGLDLPSYPEFSAVEGGSAATIKRLLQRVGLLAVAPAVGSTAGDKLDTATGLLASKISFANELRSSVLRVAVVTQEPKLSAMIANRIAVEFLDFKRQEKFLAMQRAHDWFRDQMGSLAEQLRVDETAVEQYRQHNRLDDQSSDIGGSGRTATVNRKQLDAISAQLAEVSRERARKEGQLAQAQAVLHGVVPGINLPEVLASPNITQLLSQTSIAVSREAGLATTEGAGNPELLASRAQLQRLQLRLDQEVGNVVGSLSSGLKAAQAQEQALQDQIERLRRAVSEEDAAEVELRALQTKARATRNIYESFLVRTTQLANVTGIQEPDASLVSNARPPLGASGPQTFRLVAVAGALSLAVGIGLACGLDRLCSGFTRPEQVEATLGLPLLALTPALSRKARRMKRHTRSGLAFECSLDNLRGQMRSRGDGRPKLIMVTSALPKEGKSTFALRQARNAATAGWKVLLIECDFSRSSLADELGIRSAPGLCDIVSGDLLGESRTVVHEVEPQLHVIVGGFPKKDPQELLASSRMAALLQTTRERYDLVILDTPPVLPVPDALVLARQVDATLIVVRWEKTAREFVQDAVRRLRESRGKNLGVIMRRIDLRTASETFGRMSYAFSHYRSYQGRLGGRG